MSIAPRPHSSSPWIVGANGSVFHCDAIGRHDVHVMEQQDRLAGRRRHRGFQPRVDDRLARRRFVARRPGCLRARGSPARKSAALRVSPGGLEVSMRDVLLKQARDFVRRLRAQMLGR